jgi:hypothetical protein
MCGHVNHCSKGIHGSTLAASFVAPYRHEYQTRDSQADNNDSKSATEFLVLNVGLQNRRREIHTKQYYYHRSHTHTLWSLVKWQPVWASGTTTATRSHMQSPIHHPLNTVNPRASKDIISMCHICCSLFFHPRTVILSNTKCNYVNIYFQMDVLYATNCPLQINTDRNTATELSTNHSLHGKENHNISFLQQSILMIWRQRAWWNNNVILRKTTNSS